MLAAYRPWIGVDQVQVEDFINMLLRVNLCYRIMLYLEGANVMLKDALLPSILDADGGPKKSRLSN